MTSLNDLRSLIRTAELDAQQALVETARRFANEAGIRNARIGLTDALNDMEEAQTHLREAKEVDRNARQSYEDAVADLTSELMWTRVSKEASKTFVATDEDELEVVENEDGTASQRPTGRKVRRQVSADEAREWVAQQVRSRLKDEEKVAAKAAFDVEAAKDALTMAERRFQAARSEVTAATAQLSLLGLVLDKETER